MGQLLTWGEAKGSFELANISGVCMDSEQGRSYANQGTRRLMRRGNFWGTVQKVAVCIYDNCIVWPRYVGTPMAVNTCHHQMPMMDYWYRFLPLDRRLDWGSTGFTLCNGTTCTGNAVVEDDSSTSVFRQVPCNQNLYVRATIRAQNDVGKTITIFGIDYNGQPIRTKDANGVWQDGVKLTLAIPFVSTPFKVRRVDRVIKDETQMPVWLWYYDADTNMLLDAAVYDPSETAPVYRKSILRMRNNSSCNSVRRIEALVKLEFIPVKNDTDLVLIDNLDALKEIITAIRHGEAGDSGQAMTYELRAVHELNLEIRNKIPLDQIPIAVESFGTAYPIRHSIGRIV